MYVISIFLVLIDNLYIDRCGCLVCWCYDYIGYKLVIICWWNGVFNVGFLNCVWLIMISLIKYFLIKIMLNNLF